LIKKQTLEVSGRSIEPVAINGDIIKLGSFLDIVYEHDDKKNIVFIFYLLNKEDDKEYKYSCKLKYDDENKIIKIVEIVVENLSEKLRLILNEKSVTVKKSNKNLAKSSLNKEVSYDILESLSMVTIFSSLFDRDDLKLKGKISFGGLSFEVTDDLLNNIKDIGPIISLLNSTFTSIRYIGPLRATPKRFYQTSGERSYTVGIEGERAIQILYDRYLHGEKDILDNIEKWLKIINVAKKLSFKNIDKEGNLYSLIIKEPTHNIDVNIADVGFGVSQIMPILVEAYLPSHTSTIILEQPEIHLHPLAQMILADIIIDSVKLGKRFIIETHSEHLLLRIQRRVSEKIISHNDVAFYYFKPTKEEVNIINLNINENGLIDDIPEGFMDEKLEEAYHIALNEIE